MLYKNKRSLKPVGIQSRRYGYVHSGCVHVDIGTLISIRHTTALVERCRSLIRLKTAMYFEKLLPKIPLHVKQLIGSRQRVHSNSAYRLLSYSDLAELIDDMQQTVESEAQGILPPSFLIADNRLIRRFACYSELPAQLLQAYRDTLWISQLTETMTNKALDHSVSTLNACILVEKAIEQLSLGTKLFELIQCSDKQQQRRCQAELTGQITGTLEFIHKQLVIELCSHIARTIYEQRNSYIQYQKDLLNRAVNFRMRISREKTDTGVYRQAV